MSPAPARHRRPAATRGFSLLPAAMRGFSLLEVLVALAIAGIALGAAFQGFAGAIAVTDRAAELVATTRRAQALLAEIEAATAGPFELSGTTEDGFAWRAAAVAVAAHPLAPPPAIAGQEQRRGGQDGGGEDGGGEDGPNENARGGAGAAPPPGRPVLLRLELAMTPAGKATPEVRLTGSLIIIERPALGD